MLTAFATVMLAFGAICYASGYVAGRGKRDKINQEAEQSLGAQILRTKTL